MKRVLSILFLLSMMIMLCSCSGNQISLDSVLETSREELEERLLGLSQEEIHEMWGQPDGFLSGLWGDIYLLPEDDMMIVVYYSADMSYGENGQVSEFRIVQRQVK